MLEDRFMLKELERVVVQPNKYKLVDLSYLLDNKTSSLYAIDETTQITGSHKYRLVYGLVTDFFMKCYDSGINTFVEATSGNTGLALAHIAKQLDFNVILIANGVLQPRVETALLDYDNVELIYETSGDAAIEHAEYLISENIDYIMLDQYNNPAAWSNFELLGVELRDNISDLSHLVLPVGTGATLAGLSRALNCRTIGVTVNDDTLTVPGIKNPKRDKYGDIVYKANLDNLINGWIAMKVPDIVIAQADISIRMNREIGYSTAAAIQSSIDVCNKNDWSVGLTIICDELSS
jgi:cysteine synthase B